MPPDPAPPKADALSQLPWRRSGLLTAALVVLVGMLCVVLVSLREHTEAVRDASDDLGNFVSVGVGRVRSQLHERETDAALLADLFDRARAADGGAAGLSVATLQRQLDALATAYHLESAALVDGNGRTTAHAGAPADQAAVRHALGGGSTDVVRGEDGVWNLVVVGRPHAGGAILLTAPADRAFAPLLRRFDRRAVAPVIALFRPESGELVPLPAADGPAPAGTPPDGARLKALAMRTGPEQRRVVEIEGADGAAWLVAVQWLPGRRAALVGMVPEARALIAWRRQITSSVGLAAGAVLVIATLAAFGAAGWERRRALERRERDRREQQQESRFRLMVEQGTDLIAIFEPDGTFRYISPSSRTVLGMPPEEMIGTNAYSWVHPDDRAGAQAALADIAASPGRSVDVRARIRHRDGTWRDVAIAASNALDEPAIGGFVLNGRDVTEQEAARRELERFSADLERRVAAATEELRVANRSLADVARTKDEFLASVSHELRTPLHAVLGITEAMQDQVYGALNDRQLQSVQTIEASGRDLLALINDVLDVAKIEAGRLELDCQPCSLDPICQGSVRLVREAAAKKQLTVTVALDPQAPEIVADARRLKQVLVNLLSNAVKFTPRGGRIEVASAFDPAGQRLELSVSDTGIGIAPDHFGKLFQPFRQIDARLSREYSGTGLGLALVRRLVELHGGSVAVESRAGEGSRFAVSLPLDASAAPADTDTDAAAGAEPGPAAPVALIADDSGPSLAGLAATLRAAGYRVETMREGADTVAAARASRPAVVLLGARLAGLDTLEVARRLRDDPDLATVPIVVLAALVLPGDRDRCLAAGVDLYLPKPVPTAALLDQLAALRHDHAA